jgi:tRNA (cmo5U34)-methyltransferase
MDAKTVFDRYASEYDRDRKKLVPFFDDFYGTAMRMIPFSADAPILVLDLGAGTGLVAAMIAQSFPNATIHLTDISEAMLAEARKRFAGNSRITIAVQEHLELSNVSTYDLIISALSIHHLEHEGKQTLFRKIFHALRPGGAFINADQSLGATPEEEAANERQWIADATANGATPEAIDGVKERMLADRNATFADQLRWLEDAGFSDAQCAYARCRFVVYGGEKL